MQISHAEIAMNNARRELQKLPQDTRVNMALAHLDEAHTLIANYYDDARKT